jgi:4a-hydroxytetrahydrobiopterin dehydratase
MILPPLLDKAEVVERASKLKIWKLVDEHHLMGVFKFNDFAEALEFTEKVGKIAENMNHHPEINLAWGRVVIKIFTHDRDGLTKLDFQFANKVNKVLN